MKIVHKKSFKFLKDGDHILCVDNKHEYIDEYIYHHAEIIDGSTIRLYIVDMKCRTNWLDVTYKELNLTELIRNKFYKWYIK